MPNMEISWVIHFSWPIHPVLATTLHSITKAGIPLAIYGWSIQMPTILPIHLLESKRQETRKAQHDWSLQVAH
jgi:hypothetical protein